LQFFLRADLAYLGGVGITPSQSVEGSPVADFSAVPQSILDPPLDSPSDAPSDAPFDPSFLDEFWQQCGASAYGLTRSEFNLILECAGKERNYGQPQAAIASQQQQAGFFRALKLQDLVLARACANGHGGAWEHFLELYRQPLVRAAIAISGSETAGRDLAGLLYAELYGLTTRDGVRFSPLDSYKGRGSLLGWLRTTLAQRHVDQYRRSIHELPLDARPESYELPAPEPVPEMPSAQLDVLARAIEDAIRLRAPDERLLLAAYYLDGRTQLDIARLLHIHEATVSRKLRRLTNRLRKQLVKNLQNSGLSKQSAHEALGADPRDLDVNLKKILQISSPHSFQEKADR
jgi:RNA polymerase sigma-70 factor (ECF subfamily)